MKIWQSLQIATIVLISRAIALPTHDRSAPDSKRCLFLRGILFVHSDSTALGVDLSVNITDGSLKFEEDINFTVFQGENTPSSMGSGSASTISHPGSSVSNAFPPIGEGTHTSKSASATVSSVISSSRVSSICACPTEVSG